MAEVRVRGLVELNRALRRTEKDVRLGIRKELRSVAEPIRSDAETLASSSIRNIGPNWSRMRVGLTVDTIYVAPRERGVKRRGEQRRRRPNMADLLMNRAMQPALERHKDDIERDFGRMLDRVADNFSR